MFSDLLKLNPEVCGLDISDGEAKGFGLSQEKKGIKASIIKKHPLPQGVVFRGEVKDVAQLSKELRKMALKKPAFSTKYIVVALPEEKSFLRVIQMPKMERSEVRQAVRYEAENYIPFSLEKVYFDSEILAPHNKGQKTMEVLLAAIPKKIVDPYIKAINGSGLIPVSLETESQAIARCLIPQGKKIEQQVFLADMGAFRTSIGVYYGHSLRFTSFIPVSSNSFTKSIAKKLKKEWQEAEELKKTFGLLKSGDMGKKVFEAIKPEIDKLIEQIRKQISYYQTRRSYEGELFGSKEVETLILSGGGSNLKGVEELLQKELGLPVKKGDPLANLPLKQAALKNFSNKEDLLPFTVAIGLSLKHLRK